MRLCIMYHELFPNNLRKPLTYCKQDSTKTEEEPSPVHFFSTMTLALPQNFCQKPQISSLMTVMLDNFIAY